MRHKVTIVVALLATLISVGTVGYHLLEGWPWQDAFYMTIISLTTVGFGEVHPLSETGRLFTAGLLVTGVGSVAYGVTTIGEAFVAGTVRRITRRSCMDTIKALKDHIILCGYGRLGHYIARRLKEAGIPFVIIERDAGKAGAAVANGPSGDEGGQQGDDDGDLVSHPSTSSSMSWRRPSSSRRVTSSSLFTKRTLSLMLVSSPNWTSLMINTPNSI